ARQIKATWDAVDRDDQARAHVARRGDHVQPEPAGPLNDQTIALVEAPAVQALDDLGERTVNRRHDGIREVIGHLDAHMTRQQVVVLRKSGHEIRKTTWHTASRSVLVRAALRLVAQARQTAPTREEIVVDDAVAFTERLPG